MDDVEEMLEWMNGWLYVVVGGYGISEVGNVVFPMQMVGVMTLMVR